MTGTACDAPNCELDSRRALPQRLRAGLHAAPQGYDLGTSIAVCVAYCMPHDCYMGTELRQRATYVTGRLGRTRARRRTSASTPTARALPSGSNAAIELVRLLVVLRAGQLDGRRSTSRRPTTRRLLLLAHDVSLGLERQRQIDGSDAVIRRATDAGTGSDGSARMAVIGCVSTTTATRSALDRSGQRRVTSAGRCASDAPATCRGSRTRSKSALPARIR